MSIIRDPEKKRIAQTAKFRHFYICRKCNKKYRGRKRCSRCGSSQRREAHHDARKKGRK